MEENELYLARRSAKYRKSEKISNFGQPLILYPLISWVTTHHMSVIVLVSSLLLSRIELYGMGSPFPLACFATMYVWSRKYSLPVTIGILVGSVIAQESFVLEMIGQMSLFLICHCVIVKMNRIKRFTVPLLVGLLVWLTKMMSDVLTEQFHFYLIWQYTLFAFVSILATLVIIQLVQGWINQVNGVGLKFKEYALFLVFLGLCLLGTVGWMIEDWSVMQIASRYLLLLASYLGGAIVGTFVGVLLGLLISLVDINALLMINQLAFSGLCAGIVKSIHRLVAIVGLCAGTVIFLFYFGESAQLQISLMESIMSSILFLLTPQVFLMKCKRFLVKHDDMLLQQAYHQYVKVVIMERMMQFSDTIKQMAAHVNRWDSEYKKELSLRADNAIKIHSDTYQSQLHESRKIVAHQLNGVSMLMENSFQEFIQHDNRRHELLYAVRDELEQKGYELTGLKIHNLNEGLVHLEIKHTYVSHADEAYSVMAPLLSRIFSEAIYVTDQIYEDQSSKICKSIFQSQPRYTIDTGVASIANEGEFLSGDSYAITDLGNGKHVVALSDGMGNGVRARQESIKTLDILQQLLKMGMNELTAVRSLNSFMLASSADEMYTTVDMALINLHNATATMMKIGSTPSFIKRGQQIFVITANNLPVGILHEIDVELLSISLQFEDLLIMMTDGIYDSSCDAANQEIWIKNTILHIETTDPQEFAELFLERILHHHDYRIHDDMTVVVAKVMKRTEHWSTVRRPRSGQIDISQSLC